jgi:hypothetical protein
MEAVIETEAPRTEGADRPEVSEDVFARLVAALLDWRPSWLT